MREIEPLVGRVLDVPAGALLPEVHDLLQAALGWTDSHLHQFVADGVCYGMAGTDGPEDERDEAGVPLRALPPSFCYLYDFGDGWEHDIELLGSGGAPVQRGEHWPICGPLRQGRRRRFGAVRERLAAESVVAIAERSGTRRADHARVGKRLGVPRGHRLVRRRRRSGGGGAGWPLES